MKKEQEFIEQYNKTYGSNMYPLSLYLEKLRIYLFIRNNFNNPLVQKILNFEGERITSYYDEAGYCKMVSDLFDKFRFNTFDSSHSTHELYSFTSWAILKVNDYVMEDLGKQKQAEVEALKNQIKKAEAELNEILTPAVAVERSEDEQAPINKAT